MTVEEFLLRVAAREGVSEPEARQHARAVLAALREAVPDEFFDVSVEPPHGYDQILPHPSR